MWEKEKLLIPSNSPFPSIFKSLLMQTRKNQDLFGFLYKVMNARGCAVKVKAYSNDL